MKLILAKAFNSVGEIGRWYFKDEAAVAQAGAEDYSFDANYWRDDAPDAESVSAVAMPTGIASGREAARRLLAAGKRP